MKNYSVTYRDQIGTTWSGPMSQIVKANNASEARGMVLKNSAGRERKIISVEERR